MQRKRRSARAKEFVGPLYMGCRVGITDSSLPVACAGLAKPMRGRQRENIGEVGKDVLCCLKFKEGAGGLLEILEWQLGSE
jgi:hypothetical protein